MNSIREQYKFYIYHPSNGLVEVFPENSTLEWQWEKNKDKSQAFRRKTLLTELNFKKQDFTLLHNLERSNYKCEKLIIEIHRKCSTGFTLFFIGYLALIDGDYNIDKCIVSIKPRLEDEYTCLFSSYTKEKDFIEGVESVGEVKVTQGIIETSVCTSHTYYEQNVGDASDYEINSSCITIPESWGFQYNSIVNARTYQPDPQLSETAFEVESVFAREVATTNVLTPPPGSGWIPIALINGVFHWGRPISNLDFTITEPFKNGRRLNDVIQFLIDDCGLTFVSDFFDSNPDGTNPLNFAYEYASQFYNNLVIWQKSDVKRQSRIFTDSNGKTHVLPYQLATKALIKLKDLLNWMNTMYNVQWKIIGNQFRIEHYTYWNSEKQNKIDLTSNARIKGYYSYKYEVEELPVSEAWSWMESSDKSDFDGGTITYNDTCSYSEVEGDEVEYTVSKITTNIEYIVLNQNKISDDGFVIGSTDINNNGVYLQSDVGKVTGKNKLNAPNSFANLLYYLHKHGRHQSFGKINGEDTIFYYTKPSRSQEGITLNLCCDELEAFDTNYRIKTQLGWGEIDIVKFKDPSSLMTVKLLHE